MLSLVVGMIDQAACAKEIASKRGEEKSQQKGKETEKNYRVHELNPLKSLRVKERETPPGMILYV
jgi:hypothetical protein